MKDEINADLSRLNSQLKRVLDSIEKADYAWDDHYDQHSANDMYQRRIQDRIANLLGEAVDLIQQMNAEVVDEGILHLNRYGRYELPSGYYYTSGKGIEFLAPLFRGDPPEWIFSRVEHNGHDYYIVSDPKLPMDGLHVRVKKIH